MRALKIVATAAALAAFSLPAFGQSLFCGTAEEIQSFFDHHGGDPFDAMAAPDGSALELICEPDGGDQGMLVRWNPDGTACVEVHWPDICSSRQPPGEVS